ncbi:MAG: hypothetical protein ACK4YP_07545 [Myxococcota bacterium]
MRALLVLSAFCLGCSGLLGPSFDATDAKLAEPELFAAGARATCTVKNLGDAPAPATVSFTLTLADGTVVQADEYAMLDPKEQKAVDHVFDGVRVKDRTGTKVTCTARPAR